MNRRQFLTGAALLSVYPAWAANSIQLAYVASFGCGVCNEFNGSYDAFVQQMGGDVAFVPVGQNEEDWVARAWYAMDKKVKSPAALRSSLFGINHRLKLQNPDMEELIQFLKLEGIEIPDSEMRIGMNSNATLDRMLRGAFLAGEARIEYTPAMVITRGRSVLKTIEKRNMSNADFISACVAAKREFEA